ncbi:hypothetical protein [Nocardioides lianchengensis]|uniref:Uncharacterized protein n=1 Tax=Nocardioides lianchengensis TaxID=1045774 RepID=A0A1G6LUE4_9ACTN|nr:hypothetical protein [Nocardioides lianchengensis]NYG12441.1 hypothetical protein [Nocardioides lianchengensis]SDC46873.1 hypothetical protein SAMN05421872_102363 [Nocardioides lianchengensis]
MTEVLDALRALNVPLSLAALAGLLVRANDIYAALTFGRRLAWAGVLLLFVAATSGSAIKYVRHAPTDVSVPVVTLACSLVVVGLWLSRGEREDHTPT